MLWQGQQSVGVPVLAGMMLVGGGVLFYNYKTNALLILMKQIKINMHIFLAKFF